MNTITKLFSLLLLSFITSFVYSQGACVNADFSNNNFNNWVAKYGSFNNPSLSTGVVNGRHTIMSPGVDPNSCGNLQMVPPGSTTSARLGNSVTGAQAEQLIYTLNVTQQNALFVYKYAVVLEDAGHTAADQPSFNIRLLNSSGVAIGGNCGAYSVYAGQAGQNFLTCGGARYLPWTAIAVDLTPYIGQTISIEFTTKDCSQSAHYGYAYISAECMPLQVSVAYCIGQNTVGLSGPSGFSSYSWYYVDPVTGANVVIGSGQTITITSPVNGQVYYAQMTSFSNQGNCSVTTSATIQPTSITANFTNTTACLNAPTQFTDASTVINGNTNQWFWDFGDGTTSTLQNPTHVYTANGTYSVLFVATTPGGCFDTIVQQITPLSSPVPAFTVSPNCINSPIIFTNQTTDTLPLTYSWTFGDGGTSTLTDPTHVYNQINTFTATLFATNTNGCTTTASQTITMHALPVVNAGADFTICPGVPFVLSGSGASTYTWDHGVTNGVGHTANYTQTYTVTGTSIYGCTATDQITVIILPLAPVSAGPDISLCPGDAVTLTGAGALTYSWNNGVVNGVSFVPTVTRNYILTGTDANGCAIKDTVTVTVNSLPVVNGGPDITICANIPITLSGYGAQTYVWTDNVVDGVPFINPTGTYSYTVTGTDANGCVNTDIVNVTIVDWPVANFVPSDTLGSPLFPVTFTNNSSNGITYTWNFQNTKTAQTPDPTDQYTEYTTEGLYPVSLIADNGVCQDTMIVMIHVIPWPTPEIVTPNVFSPNGDQANDVFKLPLIGGSALKTMIFNRWGQLMAEFDGTDTGWDGTVNGEEASEGVYFYRYTYIDMNGNPYDGHGFLHLIRK